MDDLSVTSKGQVTIPRDVRQKLGIRAGSKVRFRIVGTHAELTVASSPTPVRTSGAGMLRHKTAAVPVDFDVATLLTPKSRRQAE